METAIMEEAKGYESLIICYHYCLGYFYSRLNMLGWKEGHEILCNTLAVWGQIIEVFETKTAQSLETSLLFRFTLLHNCLPLDFNFQYIILIFQ